MTWNKILLNPKETFSVYELGVKKKSSIFMYLTNYNGEGWGNVNMILFQAFTKSFAAKFEIFFRTLEEFKTCDKFIVEPVHSTNPIFINSDKLRWAWGRRTDIFIGYWFRTSWKYQYLLKRFDEPNYKEYLFTFSKEVFIDFPIPKRHKFHFLSFKF